MGAPAGTWTTTIATAGQEALLAALRRTTQEDLAAMLDASQDSVSCWTRGVYRPRRVHRQRAEQLLGIATDAWERALDAPYRVAVPVGTGRGYRAAERVRAGA